MEFAWCREPPAFSAVNWLHDPIGDGTLLLHLIAAKLIWAESSTSRNVRIPSVAIAFAVAIAAVWWRLGDVAAAARCTYMTTYPSAIGRHTFLLATATSGVVTASVDTPPFYRSRAIPAQVMRVDDVAGFQADIARDGLRASSGTAVFIRYGVGIGWGPYPGLDGAFDS